MARWRFGARIGSGGFGVVCHATRLDDGLPFAVKKLADAFVDDEDAVGRFRREVRLQRSLDHPNILPIVGANLEVSPPWFAMPIAERTLLDEIAGGLSEDDEERIFREVLAAISYAHDQGVVHRDIKPENVMISHNGEVQVSDFGLGKNLVSDSFALTKTQIGLGSFPYVAPEQMISLRDADGRADIYALGKLLQHMVTGRVPVITGDSRVPRKYQYFISKCTAQDPEHRYQSMQQVVNAFEQVVRGNEQPEAPQETAERLLAEWLELPEGDDLSKVQEFHEFLERHADDVTLFRRVVPALRDDFMNQYMAELPGEFKRMLSMYDANVSGALPFSYCDDVADFYKRVYSAIDDLELRKIILSRLIHMGATHNRFHVRNVVAAILSGINETAEVMMVVDVLRSDPENASWFKDGPLREARLVPTIDDVLYGEL